MNIMNGIKNYMMKGFTPKGIVKNMAGNNPIFNNLIDMAEKGDNSGVEAFARNLMKEQGVDFDKEFEEFKKNFN